jgi:fumarate reductase flavoprotein subunit
LVNKDGYRYLQDYDLGVPLDISDSRHPVKKSMELGPRDRLSQAFVKEREKGQTIQGPYGDIVHLDLRHLGEKKIDSKIPFVRELATKYVGIDPVSDPIPVRPVLHYFMGGIDTDNQGSTSLPGLFAAGEAACVSINGANRLGSNSLPELLVFGKRAGRAAAQFAGDHPQLDLASLEKQEIEEQARIARNFIGKKGGRERVSTLRQEMGNTMESGAGIYRSQETLKKTCDRLAELRDRFSNIQLEDHSLTFNTELTAALELDFMLDVALAIAHSALARTESRGSHQRTDFPGRDDKKFLKHSMAFYRAKEPKIEYKDVIITRWPPGERVYGR